MRVRLPLELHVQECTVCRVATREENQRNYERGRAAAIIYLGGECAWCGSTEDLEFDHIDPATKSFDFANFNLSNPRIVAELAKCQLLCKPHHAEKTRREYSERPAAWTHGTMTAWQKKGCRCEICKPQWRAWNDKRNAARRKPKRDS